MTTRPEKILRDIVAGRRTEIPKEGVPGVAIVYQSGAQRTHAGHTAGPMEITPEGNVLVDVSLDGLSMSVERVLFGYGPRSWRFPEKEDGHGKPARE